MPSIDLLKIILFTVATIGTIIGFVASVWSISTFRKQARNKSLSYQEKNYQTSLKMPDYLKSNDRDRSIPAYASTIALTIYNSGQVPIDCSDYTNDFIVNFGQQANLVLVDIVARIPPNLDVALQAVERENEVTIAPVLLNPQDSFTIRAIYTGNIAGYISGEISGVDKISNLDVLKFNRLSKTIIYSLSFVFIVQIIMFVCMNSILSNPAPWILSIFFYSLHLSTIVLSFSWIWLINEKRKKELIFVV